VTDNAALKLTLKPGEEDRLLAGHLWAFSNELQEVPKAEPGSLAELRTARGRFLGLGFYNPRSLISFRLLTPREESVGADFFRERVERALALRLSRLGSERSFRLAFGESDALPGLVADKYEDVLVLQVLSAGIERRLADVLEGLRRALSPSAVLLKNDHPARALEGLPGEVRTALGEVPERVVIEQGGLRFAVALGGGSQKTGFYFDQRDNRAFLAPFFEGRRVLDLHCFTGAFGLVAARAGAVRVEGVDSSQAAVALACENARLNGLEGSVRFRCGDAEEALGSADSPDFIVLDPPGFARSRKHLSCALRAYARLNAAAMSRLPPGGLLATSTCSHHVGREAFLGMLREAAGKARRPFRLAALRGQASDHPVLLSMPETEYLNFALLEAL
jgi:23S rRNA (cytosine1962-C5)-methyltransferase